MLSTKCSIALELKDGSVKQIICLWDGYLHFSGKILDRYYNDYDKVHQLIELGNLYQLGFEIGEKHPFHSRDYDRFCKSYKRDGNEVGHDARVFENVNEYMLTHLYEEYDYIFRASGDWYVSTQYSDYYPLKEILKIKRMF